MKILITPYNWYDHPKAGGGEIYLNNLCQQLLSLGHEIKGIANCKEPFTHDGIDFVPQLGMEQIWTSNNDLLQWCDVVFTQLIGSSYGYNKCAQHKKPMFFFAHNTHLSYPLNIQSKVVYNSHWMASLKLFPDCKSTVLQPIIPYAKPTQGTKIALINCNENKGAALFNDMAETLPYQFLGIKGAYGEQILSDAVEYHEYGDISWDQIKILLVPSEIESWSQVASEACIRGIPVICSDLPGLRENLSFAGIYLDRKDKQGWAHIIDWLMLSDVVYRKQSDLCLKRASEYNSDISAFNNWLIENTKY